MEITITASTLPIFNVTINLAHTQGWKGNTAELKILAAAGPGKGTDGSSVLLESEPKVHPNMLATFRKTVAEEGVGALFKGLAPNYLKVSS